MKKTETLVAFQGWLNSLTKEQRKDVIATYKELKEIPLNRSMKSLEMLAVLERKQIHEAGYVA